MDCIYNFPIDFEPNRHPVGVKGPNQPEKCNFNPNMVGINKIPRRCLRDYAMNSLQQTSRSFGISRGLIYPGKLCHKVKCMSCNFLSSTYYIFPLRIKAKIWLEYICEKLNLKWYNHWNPCKLTLNVNKLNNNII